MVAELGTLAWHRQWLPVPSVTMVAELGTLAWHRQWLPVPSVTMVAELGTLAWHRQWLPVPSVTMVAELGTLAWHRQWLPVPSVTMVAELGTLAWHRQWLPVPSAALPWPAASKMNNESRKRPTVATYFTNLGLASFSVTTHFRRRTGLMQGGGGGRWEGRWEGRGVFLAYEANGRRFDGFFVLNRRSDGTHQFRTLLSSSVHYGVAHSV